MSRPKPNILIEYANKDTYRSDQVIASDGVWAVLYKGQPINLRNTNLLISYPGPKYKKTSFSNPGHAINLAKKLNKQFRTKDFTVVLLNNGPVVWQSEK